MGTPKEVLDLIRDTVITTGKNQIIEPLLPDEMESLGIFHMLTEECRLDRVRRIDTGDESAKLKIQQTGVAGIQTLVNTVRPAVTAVAGTPAAAAAGVRPIAQVRPMGVGAAAAAWPRPAASVAVRPVATYAGVARPGFGAGWGAGVRPGFGVRPGPL